MRIENRHMWSAQLFCPKRAVICQFVHAWQALSVGAGRCSSQRATLAQLQRPVIKFCLHTGATLQADRAHARMAYFLSALPAPSVGLPTTTRLVAFAATWETQQQMPELIEAQTVVACLRNLRHATTVAADSPV